jgi:hypothetical protein
VGNYECAFITRGCQPFPALLNLSISSRQPLSNHYMPKEKQKSHRKTSRYLRLALANKQYIISIASSKNISGIRVKLIHSYILNKMFSKKEGEP